MASMVCKKTGERIYLRTYHVFGRSHSRSDTPINSPLASRLHALIEWNGDGWTIRDFSRNGTWINKKRLTDGQKYPLEAKQTIRFAESYWQISDLNLPQDLLFTCSRSANQRLSLVDSNDKLFAKLDRIQFIPSEKNASAIVYFDQENCGWYCYDALKSESADYVSQPLEHLQPFEAANSIWKIFIVNAQINTPDYSIKPVSLKRFTLEFNVSQDEESTQLTLKSDSQLVKLEERAHHYLLLALARHHAQDQAQRFTVAEAGWVYTDQLSVELGLDISHINILIFRAKKQLQEHFPDFTEITPLIERRKGRIRLGNISYTVIKNGQLQLSNSLTAVA